MANMKQLKNEYQEIVDTHSPKNKVWTNSLKAFLVGGIICTIGQGLTNLYMYWGFSFDESSMLS